MLRQMIVNAWSLTLSVLAVLEEESVSSVVVSTTALARPFSFRIRSTRNLPATQFLFPVANDPSSFSIE